MGTKPPVIDSTLFSPRRLWPLLVLLLVIPTLGISACEPSDGASPTTEPPSLLDAEERHAEWWGDQYGEVSPEDLAPEDAELLAAASEILDRLRPHFDDARTRLVVLGEEVDEGAPLPAFAAALPDDTIVMSLEGLRLCYRGVTRVVGDSRVACVLAHELAHFEDDHHWFLEAAAMIRAFGGDGDVFRSLVEILGSDAEEAKKLELDADRMGVIRMTQAGFDAEVLFEGGESFFHEWVGTPAGQLAYEDSSHPTADQRVVHARTWFREAAGLAALFHRGVDALEAGDHPAAVEALESVVRGFPSREVLSNLGLAYYQLAGAVLAECDGVLVTTWRMPVAIDHETLLDRRTNRGAPERSPCYERDDYLEAFDRAEDVLSEAHGKDEHYLQAILNLTALHMLDDSPVAARMYAMVGAELFPDDTLFRNALLTTEVADLMARDKSFGEEAAALAELHREHPDDPDIAFNAAKALMLAGDYDRAEPIWRAFLRLEPNNEWAKIARWNLGEAPKSLANQDQPAR